MVRKIIVVGIQYYEDPFDKHVKGSSGPPAGCGHQRNRSLDSVLQRIPEDMTPTGEGAPLRRPAAAPAGSDDSGIHTPPDADPDPDPEPCPRPAPARSRESLDSGNPEDADRPPDPPDAALLVSPPPPPLPAPDAARNKDFLLRLFESKLFDMSMAISYLFKSKEPGVQTYLGNKLFSFPCEEVDFYLPQLATMYIEMADVAEAVRPYLVHRCKESGEFSLRLAWLLTAYGCEARPAEGARALRDAILREEVRDGSGSGKGMRRTHQRAHSHASALRAPAQGGGPSARHLGDLASGRAFDNGCVCAGACCCAAPRLAPQLQWVSALTGIGRRLAGVADRERRNGLLRAELAALDLNLPARVWLPLLHAPHAVLRVPPHLAAVLNSKDKAPYIIYVEVLEGIGEGAVLPPRALPPAPPAPHSPPMRHAKSEETLGPGGGWPSPPPAYCSVSLQQSAGVVGGEEDDAADCWSPADEDCLSVASSGGGGERETLAVGAGEVRRRLAEATAARAGNAFRHDPLDPSAAALKESWESKAARTRLGSPYGALPGWRLVGCIVKVGDDLRAEVLCAQVGAALARAWAAERVPLALAPYRVVCLGGECGLIAPVPDTVSLHQIKKQSGASLRAWLQLEHGPPTSEGFLRAQTAFIQSAAAYALLSYLLQLKDRHNGNILLDSRGHIVHIDFGFIFSTSPKNLGFESSPFKLTAEFVEVMDGEESDMFQYFKILILRGLIAARKHCDNIINLVEIMTIGGQVACLRSSSAVTSLRARFHLGRTEAQLHALVERLVRDALRSLSTRLYDNYQYYTNGIL